MAKRNIVYEGDECLRKVSRPVEKFDQRLWTLLDDMAETMYAANGAGLAAPQVGILRRVVVVDVGSRPYRAHQPGNPVEKRQAGGGGRLPLLSRRDRNGGKTQKSGGPGAGPEWGMVHRHRHRPAGPAFCHETDHLEGILFKDLATDLRIVREE